MAYVALGLLNTVNRLKGLKLRGLKLRGLMLKGLNVLKGLNFIKVLKGLKAEGIKIKKKRQCGDWKL